MRSSMRNLGFANIQVMDNKPYYLAVFGNIVSNNAVVEPVALDYETSANDPNQSIKLWLTLAPLLHHFMRHVT